MATTVVNRNHPRFRAQAGDVYIGRGSPWGNPYTHLPKRPWERPGLIHVRSRQEAIERYRGYLDEHPELRHDLPSIKDRRLVCYCRPLSCHGDVLAELADQL